MNEKFMKKIRRKTRIRAKVVGSTEIPRLAVSASNKHIIAQIIDDSKGTTLVYASDKEKNFTKGKTKTDSAYVVGEQIAQLAKEKKIKKVVFDRGGSLYHGRVKALADGARNKGLEF